MAKENAEKSQMLTPKAFLDEQPIVQPPATFIVAHEYKPVLFTADGKALVRRCGF